MDFAENVEMDTYTIEMVKRTFFSNEVIGEIQPAKEWTSEYLEWDEANRNQRRTMQQNSRYELLQGSGIVQGRLIGGCIEVLEFAKGTEIWPDKKYWNDSILFFETSEEKPKPELIKYWLRNYTAQGISDSKSTWGTCDSMRQLTFNWKLAMAPLEVIDYVVVHEMCHLVHLNHDRSFWRLVGKILPNYEQRENWLALSSWKMNV